MPRKANPNPRRGNGANRSDLLTHSPAVKSPGQPNGRPTQAGVPTGLPYGERGELINQIQQTPKMAGPQGPRRPLPPVPTGVDFTAPGALDNPEQAFGPRPTVSVTPVGAPTEFPDEHPMTGAIGTPSSILGQAAPGNIGSLLQGVANLTGSQGLADLAMRAQGEGA